MCLRGWREWSKVGKMKIFNKERDFVKSVLK